MTKVYLDRCESYEEVEPVLERIWEELGADEIVRGKRVLLKVNLTKAGPPEWAVCTHPDFAAAVARLVRRSGGDPFLGDSCSIYGFTRETMDLAGYKEVATRDSIPCTPLDSGQVRPVSVNGRRIQETYMSEHVLDADVIISVPKLKPHDFVGFTCAVKNMYGALPGALKPYQHYRNPGYVDFLNVILDVYATAEPALTLVDGILAMEGQGPTNGTPKHLGLVAGSLDCVAADAVLADRVGLPPVKLLSIAAERGLGVNDLDSINVIGPTKEQWPLSLQPARPSPAKIGLLGKIKYGIRYYGVRPAINTDRKDLIEEVAALCPTEAIKTDGTPRIEATCVKCMTCIESCRDNAITLKVPRVLHSTYHKKAPGYDLSKIV